MGLAEAVVESVSACEPAAQPWLYRFFLKTNHFTFKVISSVTVSFTTDLQKHFTHWRQHGVPWDEGEVGAGGAHPRPRQHAGCHHDAHAGQGDGGKRIEQSKKIALPMPYL